MVSTLEFRPSRRMNAPVSTTGAASTVLRRALRDRSTLRCSNVSVQQCSAAGTGGLTRPRSRAGRSNRLQPPTVGAKRPERAREPRAAKGNERLTRLPAQALQGQRRVMADAVGGKQCRVRPADEPGQYFGAILDAAVVVQKLATRRGNHWPQPCDHLRPAPNIEQRRAPQVDHIRSVAALFGRWRQLMLGRL